MGPTTDPYAAPEVLLRQKASECAELRELLVLVAQDLEALASQNPEHADRFSRRAMRLRARLWKAGT
jgi:hypothetical protein